MIYLLLSILSSTAIFIIFRSLKKYKVNTPQTIVCNYVAACITGLWLYSGSLDISIITASNWFIGAFCLGFLFISIFNVMAWTSQTNGLSVASVASKMSVIIPVIFGVYAYNEGVGAQKVIGILIALLAVYLTSIKPKEDISLSKSLHLPIILFIGSGIIDTSIKYLETTYVALDDIPIFSATIFACAAVLGFIVLAYTIGIKKQPFEIKAIPFGIALGIVNYCSIFFLLKALQIEGLESSTLFTVNNVAIVALTTLVGLLLFKENISKLNWLGISLAFVAIILVTLA